VAKRLPCPICLDEADSTSLMPVTLTEIECDRCGRFRIGHDTANWWRHDRERRDGSLRPEEQALLPYLSAHTRQSSELVTIRSNNWQEFARLHTRTPVSRKRQRLLELIAQRSLAPGEWVTLDSRLVTPLLDARDDQEFEFLVADLRDRGYIQRRAIPVPGSEDGYGQESLKQYALTVLAWEMLEPTAGVGVPGTCFVAMSFDPELNPAFDDGIRPAVEVDCGLRVLRVDREEHNDNITDRILAGIRSAQFVIADFTLQRQGVYFEAGFALGLGRTVIWICRADDFARVHFDTRQYNHIVWTDAPDLRRKLADRIKATVTLPVQVSHLEGL
jgi:nucleoside 2-deoxyribosyltransferase